MTKNRVFHDRYEHRDLEVVWDGAKGHLLTLPDGWVQRVPMRPPASPPRAETRVNWTPT